MDTPFEISDTCKLRNGKKNEKKRKETERKKTPRPFTFQLLAHLDVLVFETLTYKIQEF